MPAFPRSITVSSFFTRWLPLLLVLLVVIHRFWLVYSHSINIPYQDDIIDFLQFINRTQSAHSAREVFDAWFSQHNDHRTAATRLQVYAAYILQGEISFKTLAILSNVGLVLILYLFYVAVRTEEYRWLYLLVATLLIFSQRAYRITAWGQPAFAYFYVYFYTFACLFALHKVTRAKFAFAAVMGMLASLTLGLGLLAWLLGFASLLHQAFILRNRSWLYPTVWLALGIALAFAWQIGYTPANLEIAPENAQKAKAFSDGVLINPTLSQLLTRYAAVSSVMLGSAISESNTVLTAALGLTMLSILTYITLRDIRTADIRLILCAWFAVSAIPALALNRAVAGTPAYFLATNNRYSFFSVMLICTLSLLLQVRLKALKTPVVCFLVLLAALFYAWTYREFKPRLDEMEKLRITLHNEDKFPVWGHTQQEVRSILGEAISAGTFRLPCRPYPACEWPSRTIE